MLLHLYVMSLSKQMCMSIITRGLDLCVLPSMLLMSITCFLVIHYQAELVYWPVIQVTFSLGQDHSLVKIVCLLDSM